jgi:hypothetical protein
MRTLGLAVLIIVVWFLFFNRRGQAATADAAGPAPLPPPAAGNDALDNFTQAVFQFEGGQPGNRNVVNNNPGNVRSGPGMTGTAGGYATFGDIGDGWNALGSWVTSHAAAHPDWNFYDFFNYYLRGSTTAASSDDQGNSDAYAEYVANFGGWDPTQTVASVLGGQS